MKALKTIGALIFLTALGIVLVQPVLGARDGSPGRTRLAEPSPAPTLDEDAPKDATEAVVRARPLPPRCLRRDVSPTGMIVARRGSRAVGGFPIQPPSVTYEVEGDAAWSPSGRYLAERGGRVYDASGRPRGVLFFRPEKWQWSPVADCALAATERGNLTFSVAGTNKAGIRMLQTGVADFELSPNGRRLAVVLDEDPTGLWVMDLQSGKMKRATEGVPHVMGWFSNRAVVFTKSPSAGKIRYATRSGRVRVVPNAYAGGTLERCGGRAFVTSVRSEATPTLGELVSRRGRLRQRDVSRFPINYKGLSGIACSPDGQLVAASVVSRDGEKGPLILLRSDGTFVRELAPGRTANPEWSAEGLLFVKFGKAGRGRLWFVPPGAALRPTAYRVGGPGQYDWHVAE